MDTPSTTAFQASWQLLIRVDGGTQWTQSRLKLPLQHFVGGSAGMDIPSEVIPFWAAARHDAEDGADYDATGTIDDGTGAEAENERPEFAQQFPQVVGRLGAGGLSRRKGFGLRVRRGRSSSARSGPMTRRR